MTFPPELLQLQMPTLGTICHHAVTLEFLLYVENKHFFPTMLLSDADPLSFLEPEKWEINPKFI